MVAASTDWQLVMEENYLELEAPNVNFIVIHATNHIREDIRLVVYYGHPDNKPRTTRDLRRLQEFFLCTSLPAYVIGDFNIRDQLDLYLEDNIMIDVGKKWAQDGRGELSNTYIGTTGAERVDRIYIPMLCCIAAKDQNSAAMWDTPCCQCK